MQEKNLALTCEAKALVQKQIAMEKILDYILQPKEMLAREVVEGSRTDAHL